MTFLYLKYLPSPPASEVGPVSLVIVAPLWSSQSKSSLLSFIQEQKWPENEQLSRKEIKPWNYQNRSYNSTLKLCSKHVDAVIIYGLRHFKGIYLKGLYVTVFAICLKANTVEPRQHEFLDWENSRHFATSPLVSPRNDVWETNAEIPVMTRHYPDLGNASDWSCRVGNLIQPIRSTTQIWRVTRHQYGISALVSQTSFGGETCGSVAKCRLFSQAIEFRANSNRFTFPFRVRVTEVLLYVASHLNWIPKIMVQFCYLRLYLGIENVSCRLLLWMERMNTDWNSCKNYQNIVMDSAHLRNLFGIFFITLQQHFVYG